VKFPPFCSSSLTRWLIVVVGCAVLETAQPMNAADTLSAARSGDTLLYPTGGPTTADSGSSQASSAFSASWIFVGLVGAAAGGVWYWRRRKQPVLGRRGTIQIEDTRPLGNRQFLVVASCDGRRFLLGVAGNGIQMLSPLDSHDDLHDPDHV